MQKIIDSGENIGQIQRPISSKERWAPKTLLCGFCSYIENEYEFFTLKIRRLIKLLIYIYLRIDIKN